MLSKVALQQTIIVTAMILSSNASAETLRVTSFDSNETNVRWQVVNDTVMGGRSASRFTIDSGRLKFSGYLNTNGGGFASLRSNRQDWDLSEFSVVRLKVRGDGRNYRFRLYADDDRASYQHEFETTPGQWNTVDLPIDQFYASWRGRRLSSPPLSAAEIIGMGLILADGVDGDFNLILDWIEFDRPPELSQPE